MSLLNLSIVNIIYNIPLFLFDFLLLLIFLLLLKTVFIMLSSRGNELRLESGKRNLYAVIFWLFFLLAGALIFSSITRALEGPSGEGNGEFPVLPDSDFPPGPEFIKIGDYYFSGPKLLTESELIMESAIFAVVCKKETAYDIIVTIKTEGEIFLADKQYQCWVKNCEGGAENLYVALLYTKSENFSAERIEEIKTNLEKQFPSFCKI